MNALTELQMADAQADLSLDFEAFYEAHHGRLFRALFLVTGSRQEAEDVMQEAFVRVYERWDRVGSLVDPVGYLFRTALNSFRMRIRRATTAARRARSASAEPDPLLGVDTRDALDRAMKTLTLRQRSALVLTEVLGFSSDEAGRALRVSPVTVRRLASKARASLRRELGDRHA